MGKRRKKLEQEASSKRIFEELPVATALRTMVTPTIISQIIVLIYNMADTLYVGRTNNPYMVAATSLVLPVFNITLCLAGISGVGGGALVSRLLGSGQEQEARRVGTFSLYLALVIAAAFSALTALFLQPLLLALGAGENTLTFARQYTLCVIILGGIPTVMSNVISNLVRSVGYSRQAGFGITMGGILNIALDPLFMFVLLPRGYEVLGAGIATCLSNCIACVYFLVVLARMGKGAVITFQPKVGRASRKSVAEVFAVGIPSAVSTFLFDLDYVIIDKLMVSYHDLALAAIGIVLKVERLPLNVGVGICQGMMPLVAYNFAARNHKRMNDTIKLSLGLGLVIAAVSIGLYELFAQQLIGVFIDDAQTVAMATSFLRVRVLATPLMFMSFFTVHLFQAFGQGDKALLLGVMRWLAFNIPMLYLLNALFGMYGIVWGQVIADGINVVLSAFVYGRYRPKALPAQRTAEGGGI